jgi:hypothetical protein
MGFVYWIRGDNGPGKFWHIWLPVDLLHYDSSSGIFKNGLNVPVFLMILFHYLYWRREMLTAELVIE